MDGIHGIHGAYLTTPAMNHTPTQQPAVHAPRAHTTASEPEINKKALSQMQAISSVFGTHLEYRMHPTLKQVVVKVIDSSTDTVIKELPSAELQAVYERLRESLGLHMDKKV